MTLENASVAEVQDVEEQMGLGSYPERLPDLTHPGSNSDRTAIPFYKRGCIQEGGQSHPIINKSLSSLNFVAQV